MSNFPNQSTAYLEGNPVEQVSLLTGNATPQNSPKVINGSERKQIILCDPLTGVPLDLQSGGGGGSGTVKSVNAQSPDGSGNVELASTDLSDGTALNIALNNKLALPAQNYNAATNTPAITQGSALTVSGNRVFSVLCTVGSSSSTGPFSIVGANDILADDGTGTWHRIAGVSSSGKVQKSDGQTPAGLTDAVIGVDVGAPLTFQCCVEVLRAPSGTMGNNGALSALANALQATLSDGCWMEFPAGAIATGIPSSAQVTAGVKWWTVMSSATAGQVFNNTYTPGTTSPNAIPASPTAFVTTGPGAYVNGTSATPFFVIPIPANSMGLSGSIDTETWASAYSGNANNKTITSTFGGSGQGAAITLTTASQQAVLGNVMNKANAKKQKSSQSGKSFAANASRNTSAVDSTVTQNFVVNGNTAVAGDWICVESFRLSVTGAP